MCKFCEDNFYHRNNFTVNHFFGGGSGPRIFPNKQYTIFYVVTRRNAQPKNSSVMKTPKLTKLRLQQLKWLFNKNNRVLTNFSAFKFSFLPSHLHKTITKKLKIKYHKKKVIPKWLEKQMFAAKTKYFLLFRKFSDREFILEDEPYFTHFLTVMVATWYLTFPRHNPSSNSLLR